MTFGFILTRHVNSEKTNKYWNHCVKLIRTHYPDKQIVVIDDNSKQQFVKAEHEYVNVIYINSQYTARGELLPFFYYLNNKWFDKAVIIHDSVFFHKRIPFETINTPVIPFWHFSYDKENINNLIRISSYLNNNSLIKYKLLNKETNILGMTKHMKSCFGVMCYIDYNFLQHIQTKYNIKNLVHAVHNRTDRCALERIFGTIFWIENPQLKKLHSIFGSIFEFPNAYNYNYDSYYNQFTKKHIIKSVVKIWTGR